MTMNGVVYCSNMNENHLMPEWVRSERYEFCEDFYENYTTDKSSGFLGKLVSVFTMIFI